MAPPPPCPQPATEGAGKPDQGTVTGSGEPAAAAAVGRGRETWRCGAAGGGFEAHCGGGVMAVRLGGGGRQVSRRPRRVRAWRPHGSPRGARPCSLLPPPAFLPAGLAASVSLSRSLSLLGLALPSLVGMRISSPRFSACFEGSSNFFPLLWWLWHAAQMLPSSLTIYTHNTQILYSLVRQMNFLLAISHVIFETFF